MSDTISLRVGAKGRMVVPVAVREHHGWSEGTLLLAVDTESGLLLTTEDEALRRIRERLAGRDLVQDLIDERRAEARHEDEETAELAP